MGKPDFVIDLVRSLSKPEKRYFKLFASRYKQDGEKKYLSLFSAFEKMRSDDPKELAERLKDESYRGHLAGDKHYLSEMLMTSLRQFHAESSIQLQLGTELLSVELLRNRGLFHHALRKLQRVRKEARKYELFDTLLEAINLEKEIRQIRGIEWLERAPLLFAETDEVLAWMRVLNRLDCERVDLLRLAMEKGRPQHAGDREEWDRRLAAFNPDESLTGLPGERSLRLRAQAYAWFVMREGEPANRLNQQRYQLYQEHPELIEKNHFDYVFFLFFYATTSIQVRQYKEAAGLLQELRERRDLCDEHTHPAVCREVDNRLLAMEIYLFGKNGEHDQVRKREPEAEQYFRRIKTGTRGAFIFNMATAFLLAGDYRKVIHWTHRSASTGDSRNDYMLHIANRFMQIIAHIELHDYDVAASLASACQRYIRQRRETAGGVDMAFVSLLQKCAATDERERQSEHAERFLEANGNDAVYADSEEYFPLRTWIAQLKTKRK